MGTGLRVRFSNIPSHKISSIIVIEIKVCCAKLFQSCLNLCDPMDCSPPGSTIHAILQARILEWVAMPSSRGSSWPKEQSWVASFLYHLCDYQGSPNQTVVLFKTWENFGACEYFSFICFQHLSKPCTLPPFKKKGLSKYKSSDRVGPKSLTSRRLDIRWQSPLCRQGLFRRAFTTTGLWRWKKPGF